MSDKKCLVKAIRQVGANEVQIRMAVILLAVNGIDNALEFILGLQERGLTRIPAPLKQQPLLSPANK